MSFSLDLLIRENIKLTPYSSARDDFKGEAKIFLDANKTASVHRLRGGIIVTRIRIN